MHNPSGKVYFASDFHLGIPDPVSTRKRELAVVRWLDTVAPSASAVYLVGDVFDFWFEYRRAVPKGYTRLLGKIASLCDSGIDIHFFTGNHDIWTFGYLEDETGMQVHKSPRIHTIAGKKFYIAHGDGLGPGDHGFKLLRKIFHNRFCQWMFSWLHPDIGIAIADFWSRRSRFASGEAIEPFLGEENEWLIIHAKEILKQQFIDFFIFGHRHLPLDIYLTHKSRYINLGDWLTHYTYAEFDGENLQLKKFECPR